MPSLPAVLHRRRVDAAVFGGYALIAFGYLGLLPLVRGGHQYVGLEYDPQIFIWAFAWWPHAILHGQNPFVTHAVWSPDGANLAWSTTVPGLSLLFAPLTLLVGPIISFDIAAVLIPAVSAWTAFLLCRYLTGTLWPSLAGGYLFGFSSYVLAQGGGGHVNLATVFLLPLVALLLLRFLDGDLGARGLVARLGPLAAFQILCSTELAFTLSLVVVVALVIAVVVAPARRGSVVSLLPALAGSAAVALVLTSPFLYYVLTGFPKYPFYAPGSFTADLANFVVPTKITAIGGGWFSSIVRRFPGNQAEQGAYLGLPALVVVCLYARERWRAPAGRFLLVSLLVTVVLALGSRAFVGGPTNLWLPWSLVQGWKAFDSVLTARFVVFTSLVVAVVVALWTARRRPGLLRFLLPGLAMLAVVPNPSAGRFATDYHVPAFFTDSAYRQCIDPGETVLAFPLRGGWSLLWQVERGFRFNLAGGDIGPDIPASFFTPDEIAPITGGLPLGPDRVDALRVFIADKHVTSVVVDDQAAADFAGALDRIAPARAIGGVRLYQLKRYPAPCPGA